MIPLQQLIKDHDLKINGIFHIGAHSGQESIVYNQCDIPQVYWFEANPELMDSLSKTISAYPRQYAYNKLFTESNFTNVTFNITSNSGKSSSILNLKKHLVYHPHVQLAKTISLIGHSGDSILNEISFDHDISNINMIVIDVQGAELMVLKGMKERLKTIDYIFAEVNADELYEGCGLIGDLDTYLNEFGFKRVQTFMNQYNWGDALYKKI